MKGFLKYLAMSAAGVVLIAGFTAGSATFARAQDEAAAVGTEPEKAPPLDFEACWSGITFYSLADENYGDGYGYIYITQSGKKFVLDDSYLEFVWPDGGAYEAATGYPSGKASSTGFKATVKYKHGCQFKVSGTFGGYGIVGTYKASGCGYYKFHPKGTFNFPDEPSYYCDYFTP